MDLVNLDGASVKGCFDHKTVRGVAQTPVDRVLVWIGSENWGVLGSVVGAIFIRGRGHGNIGGRWVQMQRNLRLWHFNEAGDVVILDLCRKFIEPVVADSDPSCDTAELGHYCEYLGVVGGMTAWWGGGGEGEEQVRQQRRDEEKHSTFRRLCLCTATFVPLWVGFSDTTLNIGLNTS